MQTVYVPQTEQKFLPLDGTARCAASSTAEPVFATNRRALLKPSCSIYILCSGVATSVG